MRVQRILLDSNIWRHIAERDAAEDLRRAARSGGNEVLIAPAVVYEALRTPDRRLRLQLAKVMTRASWVRLRPEVHEECMELLEEIRRLRPYWCLAKQDLKAYWAQLADWESNRGFWYRARTRPDVVAGHMVLIEGNMMDVAREEAKRNREAVRTLGTFETIRLSTLSALPLTNLPGWQGDPIESWRLDSLVHYTATLLEPRADGRTSATEDWLAPWVDIEAIRRDRTSWNRLFLYDLSSDRMRRNWLRWAFRIVQASRRTTPGTPGDNQLASYLIDADRFVTADRGFADAVSKVAVQVRFTMAAAVTVDGDYRRPPEQILAIVANG